MKNFLNAIIFNKIRGELLNQIRQNVNFLVNFLNLRFLHSVSFVLKPFFGVFGIFGCKRRKMCNLGSPAIGYLCKRIVKICLIRVRIVYYSIY